MKKRTLNIVLAAAAAVVLAVFACYVRIGATADAVVVLRAAGMTCGSCIDKVTRALQSQRGVAATEVVLDNGLVFVAYDSKQAAPERLARTVADSGFKASVQGVLTPEQFRAVAGRGVGAGSASGGCCGSAGCGGK